MRTFPNPVLSVSDIPTNSITMTGDDGKQATINFSGDSVTYSGNLPVDESARIFFNAILSRFQTAAGMLK